MSSAFGEQPQLVVVVIDASALGDAVRWEDAPGGSYPHVYATLPVEAVSGVHHVAGAARVDQQVPGE
ncbi:DUF952 domain-containing protein [Micromonospora sp. LOL_024]|uniref:DUF952 domain-containing protein n=1 Tax=Micromonospora sp. LOL_024 TaxID=3345412 RepID=UPI003A8732EA